MDAALAQSEHARLAADALAFRARGVRHLLGDLVQVDASQQVHLPTVNRHDVYSRSSSGIGELDLPYVEGYSTASFSFGDAAPQEYELGAIHYLKEPLPKIPKRGATLKVVSEMIGTGKTTVNYFFYEADEDFKQYTFYRSEFSNGDEAEACGFVNMYTSSEDNTSLNAKGANDGGSPIIIIGTINIDPTFLGQVAN